MLIGASQEQGRCRCWFISAIIVLALLAAVATSAQTPSVLPDQLITLTSGESLIMSVAGAMRVAVAEPAVADVAVVSRDEVLVTGRSPGETTLHVWDNAGLRSFSIRVYEPDLAGKIAALIDRPSVSVRVVGDRVLLEGTLRDQNELHRANQIASSHGKDVTDLICITHPLQVALQVQVVEVDRTSTSDLGVAWGSIDASGLFQPYGITFGNLTPGDLIKPLADLAAKVKVLAEKGHAQLLAAPTLVVMSGESASFLAGGEIPIVIGQDGQGAVVWKEYGIRLHVQATVDTQGYVSVKLAPEVSTLDWANGVRIGTTAMPALSTRRAETLLRVEQGATVVIGGLISQEESKHVAKVPILGDLPVLGRLFRSEGFNRGETELIFFVTPRVVDTEGNLISVTDS